MRVSFASILLMSSIALSACSGKEDEDKVLKAEKPVEEVYSKAWDNLATSKLKDAAEGFEAVERDYPYSEWATRAKIMGAYSNYKKGEFDTAIPMLEEFVKQHPANKSTPYAFYLLALCYYDQITDVGRDQRITELALASLEDVIKRYPESDYARDAKFKVDLVNDHLAGKEMEVGRYYQRRGETLAAINRFRFVVEKFQTTSHVPEAMHRLAELYYSIGATDMAKKYAAVLGHNYPDNKWYARSYSLIMDGKLPEQEKKSWLDSVRHVLD